MVYSARRSYNVEESVERYAHCQSASAYCPALVRALLLQAIGALGAVNVLLVQQYAYRERNALCAISIAIAK